ncbi:MAG: NADH-quinone oxidoreductase subunit J [Bacteroidetes bacterium]|nr:NADH-quinone oxidoreductase subunit J [Bacteroidota bacterium]MCL5026036.1 NADH-quinone oxidoreductase subunit J [Chloroflexota bacterium]
MEAVFYISGAIAVLSTIGVITRLNAVHALLYLVVSLIAVALVFYSLGAPFVAALEVIIYAGAIIVLFVFVIMLLNLGPQGSREERQWLSLKTWVGPAVLGVILIAELVYTFGLQPSHPAGVSVVEPQQVSIALFGPYVLGVEMASLLLLAGLVGAYHLGQRDDFRRPAQPEAEESKTGTRSDYLAHEGRALSSSTEKGAGSEIGPARLKGDEQ